MPIATPEKYTEMLDRAKDGAFAYPAINVTSSQTLNAALAVSPRPKRRHRPGVHRRCGVPVRSAVKDMVTGASALAEYRSRGRARYDIRGAAHRSLPQGQARRVRPPLDRDQRRERVGRGEPPLFQSHMWDGSAIELEENLQIARELLDAAAKANVVLEVEIGVVGGEEDGVVNEINEKLYSTPKTVGTVEVLGAGEQGPVSPRATFGNVHGVYKPGNVQAAARDPRPNSDGRRRKTGWPRSHSTLSSTAGRARRWRRSDGRGLRRGEDEHRHRHAVRVHPARRSSTCSPSTTAC